MQRTRWRARRAAGPPRTGRRCRPPPTRPRSTRPACPTLRAPAARPSATGTGARLTSARRAGRAPAGARCARRHAPRPGRAPVNRRVALSSESTWLRSNESCARDRACHGCEAARLGCKPLDGHQLWRAAATASSSQATQLASPAPPHLRQAAQRQRGQPCGAPSRGGARCPATWAHTGTPTRCPAPRRTACTAPAAS